MAAGKGGKEAESVEPQVAFQSWKIGVDKVGLRGNPCLLNVSFLDSTRHCGSSSSNLFQILVEWEQGNPGNPLGKLEKD